jgi:uncharacterized membrane protein AbrB (regulator of aidB expression)
VSATSQLVEAADAYPWMSGPAASLAVLAVASFRRMIRTWIRLIVAVIVAVAVGSGFAAATEWSLSTPDTGNTNCACVIGLSSLFR